MRPRDADTGKGRAGRRDQPGDPSRQLSVRTSGYTRRTMPKFEKSPPALVERFDQVAARHPVAERRKMFGYPSLFVRGNYATGLFADRWVVRLAPDDLAAALSIPGAEPFSPMPGRALAGWAALPTQVVADDTTLDAWVDRSIAFANSLPAK